MFTRTRTAVVSLLSGALTPDGELDERTELQLEKVLEAGQSFRDQRQPYVYLFAGGRQSGQGGQRPCDVLRLRVLQADPHCRSVIVPDTGVDLLTNVEKSNFLRERTGEWRGQTININ